jgi:tetratricopeptide (TPR) repeat protein
MTGQQDQALTDAQNALELSNRVPDKALELANSALSFAKEGDWETHAYAYAALGSCYASLGRFDEATRHVNEAQKIAFELRLTYVLARIHQARGWVAYSQDNSVLAFSDWQIAYDYFQQIRDLRGTAWILMHYAANYESLGLIDHSIRCQVSALDFISPISDTETYFELKVNLARSYVTKAWSRSFSGEGGFAIYDAQIATTILLEILQERLELFSPVLIEQAFQALGESLVLQGKVKEALPNISGQLKTVTLVQKRGL